MLKYIPNKVRFAVVVLLVSILLFIYNMMSYTILPWHHVDTKFLENHGVLTTIALKHEAMSSGIYMLPSLNWKEEKSPEAHKNFIRDMEEGPYAYLIVKPEGTKFSMIGAFIVQFLLLVILIKLFAYLFLRLQDASMLQTHIRRAFFGATVISAGVFLITAQYVNWYHFPFMSTFLFTVIDIYIGFFVALYLLSRFLIVPRKTK